ncbi:uncharacterized protein TRUGW13939_05359 [Talaromyces rugulosus]|uniref:Xylanolytic transcriptional activator regulatory domain-containing protein n=1 Tax=Talaromyces rugulosus TaxID=121627 RepID=A0A7H8QX79_TALRU|nr:uncharacterized protein TRUGW13939_05359 [Talaromyces rugulosus]QKX58238.1 hypothetical protein TRUGW13939_05359 [Talaromyces rugulosus]
MPNTKPRHPPPEHIHQLWDAYMENVDPVTKVFHVPTIRPAIEKAAANTADIPRGFEALMFSIYSAAVMSLKDDECRQKFSEPRSDLRSRYICATKSALSRAKFMGTSNLVVLQALVLHLLSVRDVYEPRAVWSLTGVAVRIAQGMGLERDGEYLGLPPFETEMRRRLWWLLKTHDFRAAELCGLAKFRDLDTSADSTRWPANVNDDQLYPGMTSPATESNALTDMVFISLRDELAKFTVGRVTMYRRQGKHPSQWDLGASGNDKGEVDRACKQIEDIFETKYFRYCDPSQPLHLMTMLVGRFALNVIRFLKHHPRRWPSIEQTPLSERQLAWEISIKLLEQQSMMQSSPTLKRFSWQSAYFQQWHALIHVLDTLKLNPLIEDADKAWKTVRNIYENTPEMISDTKKPIYIAVGNLCLKAYADREAALQSRNVCLPPTPEFISQLHQQRDVLNSQRQVREAQARRLETPISHSYNEHRKLGPQPETDITNLGHGFGYANFQHGTASRSSTLSQTVDTTDDNSFWFNHGFEDSHLYFDDVMKINPDLMLTQDHSWEQWDALLADSS